MHKGYVYPRYDKDWYVKNNTSCLQRGAAFGLGTFATVVPFMTAFSFRSVFSLSPLRSSVSRTLAKSLIESGQAGLSVGMFLTAYCGLNNFVGVASVVTATAAGVLSGSCLSLNKPKQLPKFAFAGGGISIVMWYSTWIFQQLA